MTTIQEGFEDAVRRKVGAAPPWATLQDVSDLVMAALRETGVEAALGFVEAPVVILEMAGDHVVAHIQVCGSDIRVRLRENA